jgi:hypothetical protein
MENLPNPSPKKKITLQPKEETILPLIISKVLSVINYKVEV